MRILITLHGTKVIEDIDTDPSTHKKRNYSTNAFTDTSTIRVPFLPPGNNLLKTCATKSHEKNKNKEKINPRQTTKSLNKSSSFEGSEYADSDMENVTSPEFKNAKHVNLKVPKISFPKNFVEKYEKDTQQTQSIITMTNNFLPTINNTQTDKYFNTGSSDLTSTLKMNTRLYSFREIIPGRKINKIKMKMIKDEKMRNKLSRVTENDFRTLYEPQTKLEKLDTLLGYHKVTANKASLIKYLNESEKLNPISLKALAESNPQKLSRYNKMCQILFHEEEQTNLLNQIIARKLKHKSNFEKIDFEEKIKQMKSEVDGLKDKLSLYSKKIPDRVRYKDLHNDMVQHYWSKYDLNRFNKKGTYGYKNNKNKNFNNMLNIMGNTINSGTSLESKKNDDILNIDS